ncbi:MAG: lytic transglycosylase domain-containing protein [Pseudomonadota bacterium]
MCISPIRLVPDVCTTIETTARDAGLDPHFFARLIWQESLFDPYAISPAGALGIAQFMPGTAKLRGLVDPFNPAEALRASADYLAELRKAYGNLGLAAAAYNGGEGRIDRYVAKGSRLPQETRTYVYKITGHSVGTWRNKPPAKVDLSLDGDLPFHAGCVRYASNRNLPGFDGPDAPKPWAMVFAADANRTKAEARARRMQAAHPSILGEASTEVQRTQLPGRVLWTAQIGRNSMKSASDLCNKLRYDGGGCMVLRN